MYQTTILLPLTAITPIPPLFLEKSRNISFPECLNSSSDIELEGAREGARDDGQEMIDSRVIYHKRVSL